MEQEKDNHYNESCPEGTDAKLRFESVNIGLPYGIETGDNGQDLLDWPQHKIIRKN